MLIIIVRYWNYNLAADLLDENKVICIKFALKKNTGADLLI